MSVEALITSHLDLWTGATIKKSTAGRGSNGQISLIGIAKLRRLILGLAVRGNLVRQNPDNEPASALLQKIKNHRSELIKAGSIKKPKTLSEVSVEEQYFPLPENWEWVRLGTLFDSIISGGTPSKRNPAFWGGEIPWASVKDLGKSKYLDTTQDHITEAGLQAGSKLAATGDVLICTRMGLGKVAICSRPIAINQDLKAVKVSPKTSLDYFFLAYTTLDITGTGTTVSGITQDKLLNYVIGLPPLEEQHRIVQKVDELMALCDRLEQQTSDQIAAHDTLVDTLLGTLTQSVDATELAENWTRLAAHFDTLFTTEQSIEKLKQTIFQLAVMGRLEEQNKQDEAAEFLLKRIDQEVSSLVSQGKIKKPKTIPPVQESEKLYKIPHSWQWVRLGRLSLHSEAGWSPKCQDTPREHDKWAVLKVSAVTWGQFRPNENKQLPGNLSPRPELEIKPYDFLISRANTSELVARSVVVPEGAPEKLMMSDKIIRFVFTKQVHPLYLNLFNNSLFAREYYLSVAGGTSSSMKNVSRAQIQSLAIPLPPQAEQLRIIQKVDQMITLCDKLKRNLNRARTTRCQLAESIVETALQ